MTAIPRRLVAQVINRDAGRCVINGPHCLTVGAIAHHRANRGAGGSKVLNHPRNLTAACGLCNSHVEDAHGSARSDLIRRGIRVIPGATHSKTLARSVATPVQYPDGTWWLLRVDGGRDETTEPREEA